MAWIGALIGAAGSYLAARDRNSHSGSNNSFNNYSENNPWAPTIPGRYNGINQASQEWQRRFGSPDQRTWVPNNPDGTPGQDPSGGGKGGGGFNQNYDSGSGQWFPTGGRQDLPNGSGRVRQGHWATTPGAPGEGFHYGVNQPGQSAQLQGPAPPPQYSLGGGGGGRNAVGVNGGGGGRGRGGGGRQPNGGGGRSNPSQQNNPYTDELMQAGRDYQGPGGMSEYMDMARNMGNTQVNNDNPYLRDAYNRNTNYHGSAAMQELMGREMDRNAQGNYNSDAFNAASERMAGYQGPAGLTDFRNRLLERAGDGPGAGNNTPRGGGNSGGGSPRYNPNAAAYYAPGGGAGGGQVGPNDPSLGNGQGTYDPYVQQTLRAEDPWSSRLREMADAEYSMSPETQAMLDMQQRRMQEQLAPELAGLAWNAEGSGRFGSSAYQMAQAQAAGRVATEVGDMRTQMAAADLGQFRQGQQFALNQGSQNYNNALNTGAQLQANRADNQTRLAMEREQAAASAAASANAAGMQQAALDQQGQLAREQMALQAFGMQGDADQFSIGGQMNAAQFGMNYDMNRTGQLMDFTNAQSGYEMGGLNNATSLAGTYGAQNLQAQGMQLDAQNAGLGAFGNAVGMQGQADQLRFGTMGQAAGLQNQWGLGMAGIQAQQDAARRSANLQRASMNQQQQQHIADQNFQAQMAAYNMGNQANIMNWQQGLADQQALQQWQADQWNYEQNAPMQFMAQYADLMNAYGSGGGTQHNWGTGQQSGNYQSPVAAAIGGGMAGYGLANQWRGNGGG